VVNITFSYRLKGIKLSEKEVEENLSYLISEEHLKHIVLDFKQMQEFIKEPLIITKADGVWYEDIYGRKYLDGISGIYVATIGHNNPRVKKAI